jgi:hypothetical protein
MPEDAHPGDDPGELSPEDLEAVDGGAFKTEFESGNEISPVGGVVMPGRGEIGSYNCCITTETHG